MLCVTISERIVRNTSRPMSTGRQTLTNASSPTNARSPTASVAHGSRWPPPPNRTERPPQIPAPRNARRQRSSRSAPNCVSSPIATTSSQHDGRARAELGRRPRSRCAARRRAMPSPRSTPSPICAPCSRSAATFSSEASARNASGRLGATRGTPGSSAPDALVELERRRQRHALGRDAGEQRARGRRRRGGLLRAISSSTSFSVMKPRFSIVGEVDPVAARRARRPSASPCRSPAAGFGAGFSSAFASIDGELVGGLGDVRDRLAELDLDVLGVELDDRARAGRLDLDGRLRRLDDAHRLALRRPPRDPRRATPRGARTRCSRPRASGRSRACAR